MAILKHSRQRDAILKSLRGRYDHPTADMVYSSIREEIPNISLGTVYRNLSLLAEQGEILKLSSGEGPDRFDGNPKPHYHFRCRVCGGVSDIFTEKVEMIQKMISDEFEGEIEEHVAFFYGVCKECSGETPRS